jgi:hypothetical protein
LKLIDTLLVNESETVSKSESEIVKIELGI